MKTDACFAFAALAALAFTASAARAADHHFVLQDLATFEDFQSHDPGQTFQGTGYVGMLNDMWSGIGPTWAHALDLSPAPYGRTLMQLDLASLAGQRIVSATLSFRILDGQDAPGRADVRVSGFDTGDGTLALTWDALDSGHGSVVGEIVNTTRDAQSIDITQLVGFGVGHGDRWLGLHLQSLGEDYLYTVTHDYPGQLFPDRAEVRIDVVTAPVPEPATWALMLGGAAALAGWRLRRNA